CDDDRTDHRDQEPAAHAVEVALLALAAAIVVLVQRFVAFWIPIAGIVLVAVVFVVGAWLVISGVPGATF
ncbi:hypothetical protein ACC691_36645, partial [Rhizobium johnstonii]|uniref:hypothetical protein n=1 Tax=Rhizobium johnstonii TaxID=3019933 RepID=UPI003F96CFB6